MSRMHCMIFNLALPRGGVRFLLPALLALGACAGSGHGAADPLVDFGTFYPGAVLDIRYATADNFTGQAVYPAARCLLRRSVAERLAAAARDFESRGYRIKVFDCYRPLSVQRRFWELVHDERYVANPVKGSRHNRGAAVDLTLIAPSGDDAEMPSAYDDFSEKAHRGWRGASESAARNAEFLEDFMERHGFKGLPTEWWHFDAPGWKRYPLTDLPLDSVR